MDKEIDMGENTVILTGANGAIGKAIACTLDALGWRVIGIDLNFLGATPELFRREALDISEQPVFRSTLQTLLKTNSFSGLVNCAGVSHIEPFIDHDFAEWSKLININYLAALTACQTVLPALIENQGAIVNITSDSSRVGAANEAVYAGTKGALASFSKSLAQEVGGFGVRVNCVSPGVIDSPMSRGNTELTARLVRKIPLKRIGKPEDVAAATAFLLGPHATYITGQVLSVDGGLTMIG
jgi:2-hydroxycyclohexanecarboxyl-CoA dehydrogenase